MSDPARKASELLALFGDDPLTALEGMPNVRIISFAVFKGEEKVDFALDAMTLFGRSSGRGKYIVIYNKNTKNLRFALARELGHIVLGHTGSPDEEEEAKAFACCFLGKRVKFRPVRSTLSWEFKDMRIFDSLMHLKDFVVEEQNKFNKFIGKKAQYAAEDVELINRKDFDGLSGWKNCFDVSIGGKRIGYCGE